MYHLNDFDMLFRDLCKYGWAGLLLVALVGCDDQPNHAPKSITGGWTEATMGMHLFTVNYTGRNVLIRPVIETFSEIRRIGRSEWSAPDTPGKPSTDEETDVFLTVPENGGDVLYFTIEIAIGNDSPIYALVQLTPAQHQEALEASGCRLVLNRQGIRVFIGKKSYRLNWIRPFPKETIEPNFVSPRQLPKSN